MFSEIAFVLFTLESIYLKSIHYGPKYEPSISNDMWPHVFIYFFGFLCSMFFGYLLGLYIFSSRIWQLTTYFGKGELLESTVIWFLSEPNRLQPGYYFLPNNNNKPEILLGEVFLKWHIVIKQTAWLNLYTSISTTCLVFGTRVFPISCHPISQTS